MASMTEGLNAARPVMRAVSTALSLMSLSRRTSAHAFADARLMLADAYAPISLAGAPWGWRSRILRMYFLSWRRAASKESLIAM